MKRRLVVFLTAAVLVSGLSVALSAILVRPAAAHECPPEGCIVDGRMTGGGRLNVDTIVTHGFELHCDVNDKPNNLQVNWDRGNRFHLTSLTEVRCLDDPSIDPYPPSADFDRLEAFGIGRLNGVDGAEIYFEFTDAGEPGKNDTAFIVIRDGSGEIVLLANANLKGGNHQAHNTNN